jgi:oxygen-dependent protoporphyrinogen oxidase
LIPGSLLKDILHTTETSRTRSIDDESIHEFISRRFGDGIGEELISGMVHGIYAGDYKTLSVRSSLFKSVWELERKYGGVLNGLRASQKKQDLIDTNNEEETLRRSLNDQSLQDLVNCSVWGLKGGLETLITSLRDWLKKKPNVILKSSESIESVVPSPDGPSTVSLYSSLMCVGLSGASLTDIQRI